MLRNFQKIIANSLVLLALLMPLVFASPVQAVDLLDPVCENARAKIASGELRKNQLPPQCKDTKQTGDPLLGPDGVITKVVRILSVIVGITAVIVIIIAGMRFATAIGDPQKASSARQTIIFALVGLAVAAAAQAIVAFLLSKVGT